MTTTIAEDTNTLISLLLALESDDTVVNARYLFQAEGESVPEQLDLHLCGCLITDKGGQNWDAIRKLKEAGFHVGPGERDSFGWLSGIVYTSKGMLVYG